MLEKALKLMKLSEYYGELLTDKQKDALDLYYDCDMSLSEIALELSVTRQGVKDTLKRAEHTLLEAEEKIGCAKKTAILLERLKGIAERVEGEGKAELLKIIEELND